MFRILKILCVILFVSLSSAQERESNFSLVSPEFIPINSSFDVSLTFTNSYPIADKFQLLVIPENKLTFNKIDFNSVYESVKLEAELINSEEFVEDIYSIEIELDDSLRSEGVVFQFLMNIKMETVNSSQLKFKGIFKKENETIAYLSPEELYSFDEDDILLSKLEFYKPQRISEKALTFSENGFLKIDIERNFDNNLLVNFWVKINEPSINFLSIYDKDFQEPALSLSTNKFQMLSVSPDQFDQIFLQPYFVGKKSWYHITIVTSGESGTIKTYCNNVLIAENKLPSLFEENELKLVFNSLKEKSFLIELLKIVDLKNDETASFKHRHSAHFSLDSSSIAAIYKMNSISEFLNENENLKLEYSDLRFTKSDAPLFSRSPELNITLIGNSYELEWQGGDYKQALNYILEKSVNNKPFVQIHIQQTDNSQERIYTYIDIPDENADVVYYRVKQQNYDGSIVYSSQVKVGRGITEPFTIGQNYPNPFNPKTSIELDLIQDSEIEITIYSLDGREITKLYKGYLLKGEHKFDFDGEGLPSGIYLCKIAAPNFTQTKKMILTK